MFFHVNIMQLFCQMFLQKYNSGISDYAVMQIERLMEVRIEYQLMYAFINIHIINLT